MANASDIITYIGVPLAVLGVLPILYTFILAVFTRRRIRTLLVHHGHKPLTSTRHHDGFTIRSSPMTTLVEVELPRYTIAPLERNSDDYWRTTDEGQSGEEEHHGLLERAESTLSMVEEGRVKGFLRGGSWRAFHWRTLIVGKKLYRIQYEDELREPAAEIDFSDLIHFLLDWGAVPDAMGWEKLKSSGLWTPAGTVLLRKPDSGSETPKKHLDWVLRTSMPDESDGVLSLTIKWPKDPGHLRESRGASSLPPGWGRLHQPPLLEPHDLDPNSQITSSNLPGRIQTLVQAHKYSLDSTSFRFHTTTDSTNPTLHWESSSIETGLTSQPFPSSSLVSTWFTAAAAALLSQNPSTSSTSSLWSHPPPSAILSTALKPSVPKGVLELLSILPPSTSPTSSSQFLPNQAQIHHARHLARLEAERLESTMPPAQAAVAQQNRLAESSRQMHADMQAALAARRQRDEARVTDALNSGKMSNVSVAQACLSWLAQRSEIGREYTVEKLAEAVLYFLVVAGNAAGDPLSISSTSGASNAIGDIDADNNHSNADTTITPKVHSDSDTDTDTDTLPNRNPNANEANKENTSSSDSSHIISILQHWMSWSSSGNLTPSHLKFLETHTVAFCFAASLVAVIQMDADTNTHHGGGGGGQGRGRLRASAVDMRECLELWRKVRLG